MDQKVLDAMRTQLTAAGDTKTVLCDLASSKILIDNPTVLDRHLCEVDAMQNNEKLAPGLVNALKTASTTLKSLTAKGSAHQVAADANRAAVAAVVKATADVAAAKDEAAKGEATKALTAAQENAVAKRATMVQARFASKAAARDLAQVAETARSLLGCKIGTCPCTP